MKLFFSNILIILSYKLIGLKMSEKYWLISIKFEKSRQNLKFLKILVDVKKKSFAAFLLYFDAFNYV